MTLLLLSRDAQRAAPGTPWVYLGKDEWVRRRLADRLGAEHALEVGEALQRRAREHRDAVNDLIGRVGEAQRSAMHWWTTNFACRHPDNSDFFLFMTYLFVVRDLVQEHAGTGLTILLDDPWCYVAAAQMCRGRGEVVAPSGTMLQRCTLAVASLLRGVAARAALATTVGADWISAVVRSPRPRSEDADKPLVIACAYPRDADAAGRVVDSFFGDLPERLTGEQGVAMRYLAASHLSLGALVRGTRPGANLERLSTYWRFPQAVAAFLSVPWLRLPQPDVQLSGVPVRPLIRRERWKEVSTVWSVDSRLQFASYRRFFGRRRARSVVFYPCENLPWERMLALAADGMDVRLVGYQHSSVPALLLNLFPSRAELAEAPMPHLLLVNSAVSRDDLRDYWPERVPIRLAGATRYAYLENVERWERPRRAGGESRVVFVGLPIEKYAARELVTALTARHELWKERRIRFLIAAHPEMPLEAVGYPKERLPAGFATGSGFRKHFREFDMLLTCNTTLALEGIAVGMPTLSFIPAGSLWLDAAPDHYPAAVHVCGAGQIADEVGRLLDDFRVDSGCRETIIQPFAPVDVAVWRSVLSSMLCA